jgi:hypothetical protein
VFRPWSLHSFRSCFTLSAVLNVLHLSSHVECQRADSQIRISITGTCLWSQRWMGRIRTGCCGVGRGLTCGGSGWCVHCAWDLEEVLTSIFLSLGTSDRTTAGLRACINPNFRNSQVLARKEETLTTAPSSTGGGTVALGCKCQFSTRALIGQCQQGWIDNHGRVRARYRLLVHISTRTWPREWQIDGTNCVTSVQMALFAPVQKRTFPGARRGDSQITLGA